MTAIATGRVAKTNNLNSTETNGMHTVLKVCQSVNQVKNQPERLSEPLSGYCFFWCPSFLALRGALKVHTVDGRNPFRTTLKPWETICLLVLTGDSEILGLLRWCRISSTHSISSMSNMYVLCEDPSFRRSGRKQPEGAASSTGCQHQSYSAPPGAKCLMSDSLGQ